MTTGNERHEWARARRRLRGLAGHLLVGSLIAILALSYDVSQHGAPTWSVLLIVGWGGILALHVAYAMGLFDRWSRRQG